MLEKLTVAATVVGLAAMLAGVAPAAVVHGELATKRYAAVRAALPPEAGYLTDEPLDHDEGAMRFHRAAYGVAPVILRPDTKPRVLLVDLAQPQRLAGLLAAPDLRLVKDFGDGLAVVERK